MKYTKVVQGIFIKRENRFIAYVTLDGKEERVHVKNTGRCRELLISGTKVILSESSNPERKTRYDLVAVWKENTLINMDSYAPNLSTGEWIKESGIFTDVRIIRPETTFENSRFDFYIETKKQKIFLEVKGVTLEEHGKACFPDAPSLRAVKHIRELMEAVKQGYQAYILFVIQMKGVYYFEPNDIMQPEFGQALREARAVGVNILAYDCLVTENEMKIDKEVPIRLSPLSFITEPLLKWYDENKRILPWRSEPTPYHVWLSEIMLQQTRVEAVKLYYKRFLNKLPTVEELAIAPEEELLKLWEGLGYYNRARNLQKAAIQIKEIFGGKIPGEYDRLLSLAGIGSYTAGAISSIAFGNKTPAVDGNVFRVLARLRADEREMTGTLIRKEIENDVIQILPEHRAGDFNQAMMDLGATICLPNGTPKCEECPLNFNCKAYGQGNMCDYPFKAVKKPRRIEDKTILILWDQERIALKKRKEKGLLAGMYELPSLEGHLSEDKVITFLKEMRLQPISIKKSIEAKHIFSHIEWHMIGYAIRVDELEPVSTRAEELGYLFVERDEMQEKYPIPTAYAAYMRDLQVRIGNERMK